MKKKTVCLLLAFALLFAAAPAVYADGGAEVNVALNQNVTATSSYVPAEGFYDASFLVDGEWETYAGGNVKLGWNTNPYDTINEDTPTDVTVALDAEYKVSKIVLKPMKWTNGDAFPRDFELQYSTDGKTYTTLKKAENVNAHADSNTSVTPITYEITPTPMRYFRIHITKHSAVVDASGSYTSAIGELELYGTYEESEMTNIRLNKPALNMNPGEQDWLKLLSGNKESQNGATFESSDEKVATVAPAGRPPAGGWSAAGSACRAAAPAPAPRR